MKIACVLADGSVPVDRLMFDIARQAVANGLQVCGVVQEDRPAGPGRKCHMDLVVLPDGPRTAISLDRGPLARGCRLNADALERAVAVTAQRLGAGADLLVINKFGKHEATGRGFRPVIAQAVEDGIPVLLSVSPLNREALDQFAGGLVTYLPPDLVRMRAWLLPGDLGLEPGNALRPSAFRHRPEP